MGHARTQHPNASLTPLGRRKMIACVIDRGWTIEATAERFQVDAKTVRKWRDRFVTPAVRRDYLASRKGPTVRVEPATGRVIDRPYRVPHTGTLRTQAPYERRVQLPLAVNTVDGGWS